MDQKCESLRQEFLRILQEIEKVEKSQDIPDQKAYQPDKYESCVKIKGKSILPPLMTERRREECQHWKKKAIEIETKKEAEMIVAKPRQRKNSYTLEEPSPVLLAYMERFGSVEPEPLSQNQVVIGAASKIAQNQEELEQKLEDRNASGLNQYATTHMQQSVFRMEQSSSKIQSAAEVTNESPKSISKMLQSSSKIQQNTPNEAECQNPDCILENYLTDISKAPVIVKNQEVGSPGKENVPPLSITENTVTNPEHVQEVEGSDMKLLSPIKDGPTWALQSPAKPIVPQLDEPEIEVIIGATSKIAENQKELQQKCEDRNASRLNQYAMHMQQSVSRMEQSASRILQSAAEVTNESGASPPSKIMQHLSLIDQFTSSKSEPKTTQTPTKIDSKESERSSTMTQTSTKEDIWFTPKQSLSPSKMTQTPTKEQRSEPKESPSPTQMTPTKEEPNESKQSQSPSKTTQTLIAISQTLETDSIPSKEVLPQPQFDLKPKIQEEEPSSILTVDSSLMNSMSLPISSVNTQIEAPLNPKAQIEAAVSALAAEQQKAIQKMLDEQSKQREELRLLFEEQQKQLISSVLSSIPTSAMTSSMTDRTESQVSSTSTLIHRSKSPVIPTVKPKLDPQSLILPESYDLPVAAKTPENHVRFEQLSALIKGHLTRRLLKTSKVQNIINSMKDTMNIALQLHRETKDYPSLEDVQLHSRLLHQLQKESVALHNIFFKYTTVQRMNILRLDSELKKDLQVSKPKRVSAVTMAKIQQKQQIQEMLKNPLKKQPKSPKRRLNFDSSETATTSTKSSVATVTSRKTGVRPIMHSKPWK